MSFIQREIDKLGQLCEKEPQGSHTYDVLFAAKQALTWALEPDGFASPTKQIGKYHGLIIEGTEGTGITGYTKESV